MLHSIGSIFIIFFYIHSLLNTWLPKVEYWRKETTTKWQFWMKPLSFHYYYRLLLLSSSSLLSFILSLETYINIIEEGINRKEHQGGTWTVNENNRDNHLNLLLLKTSIQPSIWFDSFNHHFEIIIVEWTCLEYRERWSV